MRIAKVDVDLVVLAEVAPLSDLPVGLSRPASSTTLSFNPAAGGGQSVFVAGLTGGAVKE